MGVTVRYGLAAFLVTFGWLGSSCGGADVAAAPPSDPVDELFQHNGEFCPPVLPRAPRETYGFGNNRRATTVPTLWKPQEAWICRYVARDVAPKGSNGAWYEWVMQDAPRRLDAEELAAFSTAIEQLEPPPARPLATVT